MNVVSTYLHDYREALALGDLALPAHPEFLLITPRFALSAHVVVLVLGADGLPVLAAKLPRNAGDGAALRREADRLRAAAAALGDDGSTPAVVTFDEELTHPLLLQRALRGAPISAAVRHDRAAVVATVAAWCDRLAAATARTPVPDVVARVLLEPVHALVEDRAAGPAIGELARRTLPLAEEVAAAGLPWVFEHGDLGHPNLLLDAAGRLGVLDFERAEPAGPPGHDLAFFCAYAAVASSRRPTQQAVAEAFGGRTPWATTAVAEHLTRFGVDAALHAPLLAVSCARVAAAACAAGLPPQPGARDAAGRHLALWELALAASAIDSRRTDRATA